MTSFTSFASLSAELRATIWLLALQEEQGSQERIGRQIELYNYNPDTESISIAISRPYPTLVAVCREARYETTKTTNSTWIPVYARHNSYKEPSQATDFELCIDFDLDTFNLRTRFVSPLFWIPLSLRTSAEQHRLEMLTRIFDRSTLQHVKRLSIDAQTPDAAHKLQFDAWWKGEGLEVFKSGELEHVIILTTEKSEGSSKDYPRWLEAAIKDEIDDIWTKESQAHQPNVEVRSVCDHKALSQHCSTWLYPTFAGSTF